VQLLMSEKEAQYLYKMYLRGLVEFNYFVDVITDDVMNDFYKSLGLKQKVF